MSKTIALYSTVGGSGLTTGAITLSKHLSASMDLRERASFEDYTGKEFNTGMFMPPPSRWGTRTIDDGHVSVIEAFPRAARIARRQSVPAC